ncbi:hypothetical protein [Vibrio europaeus]|uniref:Uncharacterized protein n=1 Tax=Vibrio europaeus TaxID=300876 RepID=A0ABT5GMU5_9VIBR|nr:hypothetical protein [Vibrio europaeus]MDC5723118.1 hypothetical protein [Vibrio europaeus]MDC5728075.1 hypothetical protein [Vibrio europaeus]MDC5733378.1 hypothetical protein [Vibrio europaeus]MDC5738583.1 hypothetical protein [Vibrio europaeus]MDC5743855.1 hypothetical protein [Vibrio europaeus]
MMIVTKERAELFWSAHEDVALKNEGIPIEKVASTSAIILIAGAMLEQATAEIERLNPSKESFVDINAKEEFVQKSLINSGLLPSESVLFAKDDSSQDCRFEDDVTDWK